MPLAQPLSIRTTNNFSRPAVGVSFATARPGEDVHEFRHRLSTRNEYSRTRGLELVLDREAAEELVRMLVPVVGRDVIGRMVDTR